MSRKNHCSSVWINWVSHEGSASIRETKLVIAYQLFLALWTIARQAPLSTGFSRQEYCRGCHFLFPGIFPTQGLNLHLLCDWVNSFRIWSSILLKTKEKFMIIWEKMIWILMCSVLIILSLYMNVLSIRILIL